MSGADLSGADLEGADLAGANLEGARFVGCSLFGATFCDQTEDEEPQISNGATFGPRTILDPACCAVLTATQLDYVQGQLTRFRSTIR